MSSSRISISNYNFSFQDLNKQIDSSLLGNLVA